MRKDEKREVTPEFVNMSKEILYPQIQGVTMALYGYTMSTMLKVTCSLRALGATPNHRGSSILPTEKVKGKCALGPFLSIFVI
jgi:hypothetical protein